MDGEGVWMLVVHEASGWLFVRKLRKVLFWVLLFLIYSRTIL